MRTLLILIALHAACDEPDPPREPESTSGETAEESSEERGAVARSAPPEASEPPDASAWNTIVSTYVTADGFRYAALKENDEHRGLLARYVEAIGATRDEGWEKSEALAFYVNAYNALTVDAVLEAWPTESVMRVEGFFDTATHDVAGQELTLNALENDIIRSDRFDEPRIHFVVNCASKSCPPLADEVYTAANIDAKMASAARAYVRATTEVASRKVTVSRLFEWFGEDFGGTDGVRAFVASQLEGEQAETVRNARTAIAFHDYDWAINAVEEE